MPRVDELPYDHDKFNLSPWVETPSSSRVSRFRYDHANKTIQVQWRNNKNVGYIYDGPNMNYEAYRRFARAASKGKKINEYLNDFEYRPMTPEEATMTSNSRYRGLQSRVGQ